MAMAITWITVNGQHIPIKEGQSKGDAIAGALGGGKVAVGNKINGTATGGKERTIAGKKYNTAEIVNRAISESNNAELDMAGARAALSRMGHRDPPEKMVLDYARQKDILERLDKSVPGMNAASQIGKWKFDNAQEVHNSFDSYLSRRVVGQQARWTKKTKGY